jgi:hypothetical protein
MQLIILDKFMKNTLLFQKESNNNKGFCFCYCKTKQNVLISQLLMRLENKILKLNSHDTWSAKDKLGNYANYIGQVKVFVVWIVPNNCNIFFYDSAFL